MMAPSSQVQMIENALWAMSAVRCWQSTLRQTVLRSPDPVNPLDSTGGHLDSAVIFCRSFFRDLLQGDLHVLVAFEARELLSPLYQQDAVWGEQVVEAEGFQVALGIDPVKVNVVQGGARSAVFVDEGEGWAGHVLGASGPEAFSDTLHQGRFSRSEVAAQQHDERRGPFGGELAPERDRLLGGVSDGLAGHPRGSV